MDRTLTRRIVGTASVILLLALSYLGLKARYAPPSGSYEVTAVLGDAGSGLALHSDVKVRGVVVGEVTGLRYDDATAYATLTMDAKPQLPPPSKLDLHVNAKTLLGPKEVELSFSDDDFGSPPYLAAGDTVTASSEPTELQTVIDKLQPLLDAIGPNDLASIVEALGAQRGEGDNIAKNLQLGQQLASFGARTADAQLARFSSLTDIANTLQTANSAFNRLNKRIPEWASFLPDKEQQVATNLDALARFSDGLSGFLEVETPAIIHLAQTSDVIGAVIENHINKVGDLLQGLYRYGFKLGRHGGNLDDGSEFAYFHIFLSGDDLTKGVCDQAGPLAPFLPACGSQTTGGGQ